MLYSRLKIRAIFLLLLALVSMPRGNALPLPQPGDRETAIALFREGEYGKALPIFSKLAYDFPYDFLLKYFTGACLVETGQYGLDAEKNLVLASAREVPSKVYFYLGKLYHANSNWNNAQRYYNRYRNNSDSAEVRESGVQELINLCAGQINPFAKAMAVVDKNQETEMQAVVEETAVQPEPAALDQGRKLPETVAGISNPALPPVMPVSDPEPDTLKDQVAGELPEKTAETVPAAPEKSAVTIAAPAETSAITNSDSTEASAGIVPASTKASAVPTPAPAEEQRFINFRVNDRVTYVTEDMFQEPEALLAFKTAATLGRRLDSLLLQTDVMRKKYHQAVNPNIRDSLARVISAEEYRGLLLKSDMERSYFKAASLEQEWWKDADFPVYEAFYHIRDSILARATPPPPVIPEPGPDVFGTAVDSVTVVPETIKEDTPGKTVPPEVKADELSYRIQIGAYAQRVPAQKKALFDKISKIRVIETYVNEKGETVYTTGNLKNFDDAVKLQNQVRQEGIKDAFVIAVKNGKRVSLPK